MGLWGLDKLLLMYKEQSQWHIRIRPAHSRSRGCMDPLLDRQVLEGRNSAFLHYILCISHSAWLDPCSVMNIYSWDLVDKHRSYLYMKKSRFRDDEMHPLIHASPSFWPLCIILLHQTSSTKSIGFDHIKVNVLPTSPQYNPVAPDVSCCLTYPSVPFLRGKKKDLSNN